MSNNIHMSDMLQLVS